jgi:uncharacterized protein
VIDVRELGRRAGAVNRIQRTVPAPEDLGTAVIGIPEGSDIDLDLQLESVMEGVYITGTATVRAVGECSRCLDPMVREDVIGLQELYRYPGDEFGDVEDELPELEDDLLDLEPTLRDSVVLSLPLAPVCREDCPGLCPQCGERLADDPQHQHDLIDPRWAALQGLAEAQDEDLDSAPDASPREES